MTGRIAELHLAVTGPMDVPRIAAELALTQDGGGPTPAGRGGHPITELVLALAPLVRRLDLVTLHDGLPHPVTLRGEGIRLSVGTFRPRARTRSRDLFATERSFVADTIRSWRPDVVSAHWTYEYGLGALDAGRPSLITVHDWAPTILRHARDPYRAVRLLMQATTFVRGRHFAAVSPYMAHRVGTVTGRPCHVLPNGLGAHWFASEPPRPTGRRVLAVNSGFGRRKNVQCLLAAWPTVLERIPDAELVLAGTGYEADGAARGWAQERGLVDGVTFLGPMARSDLPDLLRTVEVFAHPALEESFGMVVLEAMATGVPVLGGERSGAVPWLLADGAGVTVDVRRSPAVADGLVRLLEDRGFAQATATRGYTRAKRMFAIESVAAAYVQRLGALTGDAG